MTPILKIPGVGPALAKALNSHGMKSAEDIKSATVSELSKIPSIGVHRAKRIVDAAHALLPEIIEVTSTPLSKQDTEIEATTSALMRAEAARVAAELRAAKAEAKAAKAAKKADMLAAAFAKAKEKAKGKAGKQKKKAKKAIAKEKAREKEILTTKSEKKKKTKKG